MSTTTTTIQGIDPGCHDVEPQEVFDRLYGELTTLLNTYYPVRTVTITSADPPYVTPSVKCMLRLKNKMMCAGRVGQAAALAVKIGDAIKKYNSAELSRVDVLADPKNMWAKVRQLTGRTKNRVSVNPDLTASMLNDHYAAISTDADYKAPSIKQTAINEQAFSHVTEWKVFRILDGLKQTATGLDEIPAWFLRTAAPFIAGPIADMLNLSLSTGVVPRQWKAAYILPVAKIATPLHPKDYRPISITPILSRITERIVVKDYVYPSFHQSHPPNLDFSDQFAFQPSASTTAALVHLFHTVTNHLHSNPYVIVYALDFSKAFDSVRHSAVLDKFSQLNIPDHIYNWIEAFFRHHSHCTKFGDEVSGFRDIQASIIQGSAIGPAAYVVTASDLRPLHRDNSMHKYADDTYLVVPASNSQTCAAEIDNVEQWARKNNLVLNRSKSVEIIFTAPRSRRAVEFPPPAVASIERVDSIKALGVTISRTFSVKQHVENLLAACSQTTFALRTLRHHGMPIKALQIVFQATVVAKLSYASPAWWGFASVADRNRLEAFLRRSARLEYRDPSDKALSDICEQADDKLFVKITGSDNHLLHPLLPPERNQHYSLRKRSHNYQLPTRTTALNDSNFITRMLFRDIAGSVSSSVNFNCNIMTYNF